jgi:hypothetical protein
MAYDSGKRLLLYALVKGLGDAVRRSQLPSAIAEGCAWPPNRLLPMIQSKTPLNSCSWPAAGGWWPCWIKSARPRRLGTDSYGGNLR